MYFLAYLVEYTGNKVTHDKHASVSTVESYKTKPTEIPIKEHLSGRQFVTMMSCAPFKKKFKIGNDKILLRESQFMLYGSPIVYCPIRRLSYISKAK